MSHQSPWNEYRFRDQVESALVHVRRILDTNKNPSFPSETAHQYEDKYILVEILSRMALSSTLTSLKGLGLTDEQIITLNEWSQSRAVSLRLNSTERCTFLRETKRDVDSSTKHVVEGFGAKIVSKTVTTITEYFWRFQVEYELIAYRGTGSSPTDIISIYKRSRQTNVMTTTDQSPRPEVVVQDPIDLNISHFLHLLHINSIYPKFNITRESSSCHTPRRNTDVDKLLDFFRDLYQWCWNLRTYFGKVFTVEKDHGLDLSIISRLVDVFVPVVPLMNDTGDEDGSRKRVREIEDKPVHIFEESKTARVESEVESEESGEGGISRTRREGSHDLSVTSPLSSTGLQAQRPHTSIVLGVSEAVAFLEEEKRTLAEKYNQLRVAFPTDLVSGSANLITAGEACLLATCYHIQEVCQHYKDGVDYVEDMLRNQLISAIGKVVRPQDFSNYMRFHNRKIFLPEFQPKPFCYAVRRTSHHAPEGVLSIEEYPADSSIAEPISTLVHSSISTNLMQFTVNAAATISFGGYRHLHTYLFHRFENDSLASKLKLRAEARQFSSYIVLVGRISSATSFDAKYGMIVQNKDDIVIPLELETIPSAKEFKDAIESLSPEQQRFAKAFRSMQLESTLFGVCVIQIKPQLERVLNLPPDSLTKEIQLTQDLMELFLTYQIPSDLLSYDGESVTSVREKLDRVKQNVKAIRDMINASKERELEEKRQEARYASPLYEDDVIIERESCQMMASMSPPVKSAMPKRAMMRRTMESSAPPPPSMRSRALSIPTPSAAPPAALSQAHTPPAPQQSQPRQEQQQQQPLPHEDDSHGSSSSTTSDVVDYTKIPKLLDSKFEALDKEGAVRPTIINPGKVWSKSSKKSLLAESTTSNLNVDDQKKERSAAFDLLDALTKSGGFEVHDAELHVVIAATHCFDRSVVDTVVQKNVNPIEKVEFTSLIMASTIHNERVANLVQRDQVGRLLEYCPELGM